MDAKGLVRTAATLAAIAVPAIAATPAAAQVCRPAETVAALDQYCDFLPTTGGRQPARLDTPGRGPSLSVALPPRDVAQLRNAGPAARALLMLPANTPTDSGPAGTGPTRQAVREARKGVASGRLEPTESDVKGFASGLASASGRVVGSAFRWGLLICTLGLVATTWLRFRSRLKL